MGLVINLRFNDPEFIQQGGETTAARTGTEDCNGTSQQRAKEYGGGERHGSNRERR